MIDDRESNGGDMIDKEDARVGYQVAVDLWTYQGELNWNRFSVMLVANSVIIAVIGAVFSGQRPLLHLTLLTLALAFVGLLLCVAWVLLAARGFDFHRYWRLCAWELEERYLGDTVRTLANLQLLADGKPAYFGGKSNDRDDEEDGEKDKGRSGQKIHRFGRLSNVSQRPVAYSVIAVFAVMYLVVFVYDILETLVLLGVL